MCVDVLGMHGEVEDVFRRAGHAGGGGGGMERELGVRIGEAPEREDGRRWKGDTLGGRLLPPMPLPLPQSSKGLASHQYLFVKVARFQSSQFYVNC